MNAHKIYSRLKSVGGAWGILVKELGAQNPVFEHNADRVFPSASVGKVPIALYILHLIDVKRASLDTVLTVRKEHYLEGSGLLQYFTPRTKLTVRDLGILMLTISDNTAAKVLVSHFGAANINTYLRSLGFKKTKLGVHGKRFDFGITTPREMASMLEGIYAGKCLSTQSSYLLLEIMKRCQNELGIRRYLPRKGQQRVSKTVEVANKTGALNDSRNDVGIIFTKRPYVVTVFSKDVKDYSFGPENAALLTIAHISKEIFNHLKSGRLGRRS